MIWRIQRSASLPSTSDRCIERARAGEPDGFAALAGRQTAGRGSRGRVWTSPPGALCLSVLIRPDGTAHESGHWALLAAVALHDTLAPHAPPGALCLKWPNDLLLRGRKLGGILLDAASSGPSLDWLVIGFGANLASAPDGAAALATTEGPAVVAGAVLDEIDRWRRVRALAGWAPVRAAWLARAHPPGTPIRIRTAAHELGGCFDGLNSDGALLLRDAGHVHAIQTGEVLLAGGA